MAKLNGVKTIDMVNSEITKVAYDGAEYAKVEGLSSEVISEGDIAYVKTSRTGYFDAKSFYEFIEQADNGNYIFKDNYGHRTGISDFNERTAIFRKISAPTLEERVTELESDVAALKGEKANEIIEFEGATYRKVDREAREGDVVIFRKTETHSVQNNTPYKVGFANYGGGNSGLGVRGHYRVYNAKFGRTRETVDVYEAKYIPQVGDIVVVTGNTSGHSNSVGDIGKVGAEKPLEDGGVKVYVPGNSTVAIRTKPQDIRKATPAEVEAYEKAAHKASFAVGDYVKIVKSYVGCEGEVVKITEIGEYRTPHGICEFVIEHSPKLDGRFAVKAEQIVKATDAEIAKATAPKLKAGDFVKITSGTPSIIEGEIYEVLRDDENELHIIDNDGDSRWFPLALGRAKYEIVDAETAKWAKLGRKVNEFKKGDIVRVTKSHNGHPVGTIGKLVPAPEYIGTDLGVLANGHKKSHISGMELIAPVESTLN